MIVRNGSSALTEVHFDGKSEKQVFVGNNLVWPTMDLDKYSFRLLAHPKSTTFDYTVSRNVDGITSMGIQNSYNGEFLEITPSTKIASADMKRINYKVDGAHILRIYYAGNYIPANMFDESDSSLYNHIHLHVLHIFTDLDYIGDNAFKNDDEGIRFIKFYKNVTKVPLLSPTALPKYFLPEGEIDVPKSLEEAFKKADVWKNYADIIIGY